jgi:hypothetical protein
MKKVSRLLVIAIILVLAGTVIFLGTWEIPAPVAPVETVIPDNRFPK